MKLSLKILFYILKILGKIIILRKDPQIIAITGSVGKTTTKEAIYCVLKQSKKFRDEIWKTHGNLNAEIGIPLTLLGYQKAPYGFEWILTIFVALLRALFLQIYPKIIVLEVGIEHKGDMEYFTEIFSPRISIITMIGPAHVQNFKNIDEIAREKAILAEKVSQGGYVILNKQDNYSQYIAKKVKVKIFWVDGQGNILSKQIARKVGEIYGLTDDEINLGLDNIKTLKGRLNNIEGLKKTTLIDDTYNANPASVSYALDYLANYKGARKIAILGDMLELGQISAHEHYKIGKKASKLVDLLVCVGEETKKIYQGALDGGMREDQVKWFKDKAKLLDFILNHIQENDIILIKGSQGMRMEKITAKLMQKSYLRKKLLVRQEGIWKTKE